MKNKICLFISQCLIILGVATIFILEACKINQELNVERTIIILVSAIILVLLALVNLFVVGVKNNGRK